MRSGWGALAFVLVCQMAGLIGALTTGTGDSSWYQELEKPAFQPPGWVFGPTWTLLYTLMGVAAWRVWRRGASTPGVRRGLVLFALQLLLNAVWSPVFFGAHRVDLALVILVALTLLVLATSLVFRRVDRPAFLLMLPYLGWVVFATVLNASILHLNGPG